MISPARFRAEPAVILLLLLAPVFLFSQNDRFEIVYMAETKYVKDRVWLNNLKTDWQATGVNLRLMWAEVENESHVLNWTEIDAALRALAKNNLDIYIRVSLIFTRDQWFADSGYYTADDFHRRWNGDYYLNRYPQQLDAPGEHGKMLTFISLNARSRVKQFYHEVVVHLEQQPVDIKKRIRLIVPALTPDDESEYPSHGWIDGKDAAEMTGYAKPEQEAFVKFLQAKYDNDRKMLNLAWESNFTAINTAQIQIAKYNWQKQQGFEDPPYQYAKGRKDWIDFKTEALKKFFEELAVITHEANFKFGLQFGSLYDNGITYRGFYDPTSLLEEIDYLITGEILEYEPNFEFSADYSRSLCKYWDWKNSRAAGQKIKFATETNWPEYNHHTPQLLCASWTRQVCAFYERGAAALFVSHWGTTDAGEGANVPARVKNGKLKTPYAQWAKTLKAYKGAPVQNIINDYAAHLSCEQSLYFRCDSGCAGSTDFFYNNGFQVAQNPIQYEFPFTRFVRSKASGQNLVSAEERNDIVTNYMLIQSPAYLTSNYKKLRLTTTSSILPKAANQNMQRNEVKNMIMPNNASLRATKLVE